MRARPTVLFPLLFCGLAFAQEPAAIADKAKGLSARPGLFESYVDARQGKALLKLPPADKNSGRMGQFLYVESLATGLGANAIGLDRTGYGRTYVVDVRQVGPKVIFEAPNLNFRAETPNLDEQRAVREGFATSVIWAGKIEAQDPDGSVLVDITDFLVRDAHDSVSQLGSEYSLNRDRSLLVPERCKAFPDNLEFEALLTFTSTKSGQAVGEHAPEAQAVTLTQRHSFVRLPEPGYRPRAWDPRAGCFAISYLDFAAPLDQPLRKLFITRHRLDVEPAGDGRYRVKEPIVYYVDRGVPEPVRTALIDGGNYWKRAFEEIGLIDAFRVELMPEGIDPLDVRYNVIQWMNRSTRGWAYGQMVVDPRTGEIIKGAVNLDSQRARQDILLFEALIGVEASGKGGPDDPIQVALSRIRQLSAHEIGHTLGFRHNFAASTVGRSSVMDYPAPLIRFGHGGLLDLSDAYAPGIGDWDVQTVRYAYSILPAESESEQLSRIIRDGVQRGLRYLTDDDTPEPIGANPVTNRWDNGDDPVEGLRTALAIRQTAMQLFGERNLRSGRPLSDLELVFGPLYYFHRYDVDAAAKMVGGVYYAHRLAGDGEAEIVAVPLSAQQTALETLVACLSPEVLAPPDSVLRLVGPLAPDLPRGNERFPNQTPYVFDTLSAASSAADLVLARLLNPGRCARIVEMEARGRSLSLGHLLQTLVDSILKQPEGPPLHREITSSVSSVLAYRLMALAGSPSPAVRARATEALKRMRGRATRLANSDATGSAANLAGEIDRFLARPWSDSARPAAPPEAIPGPPIGNCGV